MYKISFIKEILKDFEQLNGFKKRLIYTVQQFNYSFFKKKKKSLDNQRFKPLIYLNTIIMLISNIY